MTNSTSYSRTRTALPLQHFNAATMKTAVFKIWRGDASCGKFVEYTTEVTEGMVVLDAVHEIQAREANDLACRWNCNAGQCGAPSGEVHGLPRLRCMPGQ